MADTSNFCYYKFIVYSYDYQQSLISPETMLATLQVFIFYMNNSYIF